MRELGKMNIKAFWGKFNFNIVLLVIMIIAAVILLSMGETTMAGVPDLKVPMMILLIVVGLAAGLLGGWIGTGGCSVMLPILRFWLSFPLQ